MRRPLRRPRADALRAAAFRDAAREIVRKDRADRKAGLSVDTGSVIARAMELAYRRGYAEAQITNPMPIDPPSGGPIVWDLIPRRPRRALWFIYGAALGDGCRPETVIELFPAQTAAGAPGWRLSATGVPRDNGEVYADREMKALTTRGLVAPLDGPPRRMVLTERGRATWRMALDGAKDDYPEM